jgi:hypothetical protein
MKKILFKYFLILLAGYLLNWWVFHLAPFKIPIFVLGKIRLDGLFLMIIMVITAIFSQKEILLLNNETGIGQLTLYGFLIGFFAEMVFQLIYLSTSTSMSNTEKAYNFLRALVWLPLFATAIYFFVAFQFKTRRTGLLILIIVGFLLLLNLMVKRFIFLQ